MTKYTLPFTMDSLSTLQVSQDKSPTFYLGWYFPYREGRNPSYHQDHLSQGLYQLNSASKTPTPFETKLSQILSSLISSEVVICAVPHPDPSKVSPATRIAAQISSGSAFMRSCGSLIRTQHVGDIVLDYGIDQGTEYNSLGIINPAHVAGKQVVLIDMIATSGIRLAASKQKLIDAGAIVTCLAFGKTLSASTSKSLIPREQLLLSRGLATMDELFTTNQNVLSTASRELYLRQTQSSTTAIHDLFAKAKVACLVKDPPKHLPTSPSKSAPVSNIAASMVIENQDDPVLPTRAAPSITPKKSTITIDLSYNPRAKKPIKKKSQPSKLMNVKPITFFLTASARPSSVMNTNHSSRSLLTTSRDSLSSSSESITSSSMGSVESDELFTPPMIDSIESTPLAAIENSIESNTLTELPSQKRKPHRSDLPVQKKRKTGKEQVNTLDRFIIKAPFGL